MSAFVESLKRLYAAGSISTQKLVALRDAGKITEEEYVYVRNDPVPA